MVNFKDFFRKSSVFIIDDVQFLRGKESLQEEFFILLIAYWKKAHKLLYRLIDLQ